MQLDWFPGRSVLSDKLLRDSLPEDYENEVKAELGEQALPAFRHALQCFQGQLRASGEPAICHTADVAIRAADLALPPAYVITSLLHDSVEDTSDTPAEMVEGLAEVSKLFGDTVRADVRLLTNRYNLIVRHAMKSLAANSVRLTLSEESLARVAAEIRVLRRVQPAETQEELSHEYTRLARIMPTMDLSKALEISRFNRKYNLDTEISLQLYGLFIDDMVDDFKQRQSKNGPGFYDTVLVVKFFDAIDNLRTSAATERLKLEKILQKVQMILDKSFHLHEYLYSHGLENRTFPLTYEMLKYTMVEQMIERKQALQNLADTRFSPLSEFMVAQISSLETKYKIERPPPERLRELRAEVRTLYGLKTPANPSQSI